MSHIEEVKTDLADKNIILDVCKELKLKGTENVQLKIYDGAKVVADICLTENLGLKKGEDGNYSFVGDFWYLKSNEYGKSGLSKKDDFVQSFTRVYTEKKVDKELKGKRFRQTKREQRADGTIVLKYVKSL